MDTIELNKKKLEAFITKSSFSILILGERGTGKSRLVDEIANEEKVVQASCASFANDTMAESELFGYTKGAFTGAEGDTNGLLKVAHKGIFFLDELHCLSKSVQSKLMKAIQTDSNNMMSIRKIGATKEEKIECQLIFATNKSIQELQTLLLPDFYDRIAQHAIEMPSLREQDPKTRAKAWEAIWKQMKFEGDAPKDAIEWIKTLELYGNYRDLQKIAIYYNTYNKVFDNAIRKSSETQNSLEYAKLQYKKLGSPNNINNTPCIFEEKHTHKDMLQEWHYELQNWAIIKYGNRKEAAKRLGVNEKTLNNWKNKSSTTTE